MAKKLTSHRSRKASKHNRATICSASYCDMAQGYFIARPMPGTAYAAWVSKWNPAHHTFGAPYFR
jgi:hypothetical protein